MDAHDTSRNDTTPPSGRAGAASGPADAASDPFGTPLGGRRALETTTKLARARVPVWIPVVVLLGVCAFFGYVWFGRQQTDLGPAVKDARRVELSLLVCNETVDARGINPRQAELDLQSLFEKQQGVADAQVRIEREDCGSASTTTKPG